MYLFVSFFSKRRSDAAAREYEQIAHQQLAEFQRKWEDYRNVIPRDLLAGLQNFYTMTVSDMREHQQDMARDIIEKINAVTLTQSVSASVDWSHLLCAKYDLLGSLSASYLVCIHI